MANNGTNDIQISSSNEDGANQPPQGKLTIEQQLVDLVRKRLRKISKKMKNINNIEKSMNDPKFVANPEQKLLLANKAITSALLKEFTDLNSQMGKLISPPEEKKKEIKEEKKVLKKNNKREKKNQNQLNTNENKSSIPNTNLSSASSVPIDQLKSTQNIETKHLDQDSIQSNATTLSSVPSNLTELPTANNASYSTPNIDPKTGKTKKEWEFQKEIYNNKYKQQFTKEQEGKFISVYKGVLYGPCDTLEQLKQSQGEIQTPIGMDVSDVVYVDRIGDDDRERKPKKFNNNNRGRGGRSGRGGFSRGGNDSNRGRGRGGNNDRRGSSNELAQDQ